MPPPELDLPLEATFPCRPAPGARSRRHPVTIQPGWTVDTGHDDALEDIATALGGTGASCRSALAGVLPAFREWHGRALRTNPPRIGSPDCGRTWFSTDRHLTCCPATGYADPAAAAAHARSVTHVAKLTACSRHDLCSLVEGLGDRADPEVPVSDADPDRAVLQRAWACGLHPQLVRPVRTALAAGGDEPDELTLLGVVQTGADPTWVAGVATSAQGELARQRYQRWAAWTPTEADRADPMLRSAWLASGTRRCDLVALTEAGYRPSDARDVAEAWRMSVPGAAQRMAEWVAAGYHPRPDQLGWIAQAGIGFLPGHPPRWPLPR